MVRKKLGSVVLMKLTFIDVHGNSVNLILGEILVKSPQHVWAICKFQDQWVLTHHKKRGLEFPGGKIEVGETAEEAVKREIMEEIGGIVDSLRLIGQYEVEDKEGSFVKNIYFAKLKEFREIRHYFETNGPVLLDSSFQFENLGNDFSFIMKDETLRKSLDYLKENDKG